MTDSGGVAAVLDQVLRFNVGDMVTVCSGEFQGAVGMLGDLDADGVLASLDIDEGHVHHESSPIVVPVSSLTLARKHPAPRDRHRGKGNGKQKKQNRR